MASTARNENTIVSDALEKALVDRGNAFSFLQAYRTLFRIVQEQGGNPEQDIRIRPALSLELPKAAISSISKIDADVPRYEIQTSFLGLYGASSPLPNFYTEDLIAAEQEDEIQARLLLDVFHQRSYRLYASVLQKFQPVYELAESKDSHFLSMLWSLVGLRDEQSRASSAQPGLFLHYVNLFGRQHKSAAGLQFMLADFLDSRFGDGIDSIPVEIEQCVEQRLDIPVRDRLGLGMGKALGVNTVIGRYIKDYNGKIVVRVGPISVASYQELISESCHWQGLETLVRSYIGPALTCELEFSVTHAPQMGARLGDENWGIMGMTTWLDASAENRDGDASSQEYASMDDVSGRTLSNIPLPNKPTTVIARVRLQ